VVTRRELAMILSQAPPFPHPRRDLEQYVTDGDTASELLWYAFMLNDIENRSIADLGCGTGVFSLGSALLGADRVLCIDIDHDALQRAKHWFLSFGVDRVIDIVCEDATKIAVRGVEVVVMNPPFGVHKRGADLRFLDVALRIAERAVYSIHKLNPESHRLIESLAKARGFSCTVLSQRTIMIPCVFETHTRKVYRVRIGIYRFVRSEHG